MIRHHPVTRLAGLLALVAAVALWLAPAAALAQVHDNAHLFSQGAVDDANASIGRLEQQYKKQLVIETFPSVPDDKRAVEAQDQKAFFKSWMSARAKELKVNGVYALICMEPKYVETGAGSETRERGIFTQADLTELRTQLQGNLRSQQYDAALSGAVDLVGRAFTANIPGARSPSGSSMGAPTKAPVGPTASGNPGPAIPGTSRGPGGFGSLGCGALLCVGVGLLIIFALVRSVFRRGPSGGGGGFSSNAGGFGGGGGGANYPTGGPGYGPGYGNQGGGRTGSGFGSGLLGGLLGGAVGGYAADRFEHRNDPTSSSGGGGDAGSSGGSFGGGGGGPTFDPGPSDAGAGFGDAASGGDFGGGGGGGDSGGGGGDSGGGGGDSGGGF